MDFSVFRFSDNDIIYDNAKIEYYVNNAKINTCAFETEDSVSLSAFLPRTLGTVECFIEFFQENQTEYLKTIPLAFECIENGNDVYCGKIEHLPVGLYFYRLVISNGNSWMYGTGTQHNISFSFSNHITPTIQYSVSHFQYPKASDEYGGIIYHIFVDRFAKGGDFPSKQGAITNADFSQGIPEFPPYPGAPLKNNTFFGGTLKGIEEKLPYLSSLGVSLIYLSPIFTSPSNHKYDTADYMSVDSMFGGDQVLIDLIHKAEECNIGIILDGVFNHTGADSIYFNRFGTYSTVGAFQSQQSPYYSWYRFEEYPEKYSCWWGIEILPRIHPEEPSLCEFITGENGVIAKYRKMGIRGFRLDVVDELSDSFIEKIKYRLHSSNPTSSLLFGEVWEDASNKIAYEKRKKYYLGTELDGVMNYPLRTGIIDFLRDHRTESLRYALTDVLENMPIRIRNMQMNLLGSHDTTRILTALAGKEAKGYSNAELNLLRMTENQYAIGIKKLKMAYTILATVPGLPTIYYGDEAGLEGYSDPFNRMPFPWDNINQNSLNHYIKVGQIRKQNNVYQTGDFEILYLSDRLFIFSRKNRRHSYVTIINNTDEKLFVSTSRKHVSLLDNKTRFDTTLDGYSSQIIRVLHDTTLDFTRVKE